MLRVVDGGVHVVLVSQIWALDVSKSKSLATGGSDSLVNIWRDCTEKDEEAAAQKEVLKLCLED